MAAAACTLILSRTCNSASQQHNIACTQTLVGLAQVGTAWRPDKLKEMTYTQFWHLVQQRQIDKVHRLLACCMCNLPGSRRSAGTCSTCAHSDWP